MIFDISKEDLNNLIKLLQNIEERWAVNLLKKFTKQKIKTSSCKAKGREFQKMIAQDLADKFNLKIEKDTGDIEVRQMGQSGVDIILRNEGLRKFPFSIECKNTKNFLTSFIEQAKSNQKEGTDWLLVWKGFKKEPIVILEWEVFLKKIQ